MAFVTSEPNKINVEDVQFSTSVSEAVGNKLASTLNYVIDNFDRYEFGVSGAPYSSLSAYPYTFSANLESMKTDCEIFDILFFNNISGTSGNTVFYIERQLAAGGAWTTIFSTNCSIANTAADNLSFSLNAAAPSGVTLPVLSISSFAASDKLRWVLVSAASDAEVLNFKVIMRPI